MRNFEGISAYLLLRRAGWLVIELPRSCHHTLEFPACLLPLCSKISEACLQAHYLAVLPWQIYVDCKQKSM